MGGKKSTEDGVKRRDRRKGRGKERKLGIGKGKVNESGSAGTLGMEKGTL
jgi:hypothetical protein